MAVVLLGCGKGDGDSGGGGGPVVAPIEVTASTDLAPYVEVRWKAAEGSSPTGFVVMRDGAEFATVPSTATAYEDTAATAGSVTAPNGVVASKGTAAGRVSMAWNPAKSFAGDRTNTARLRPPLQRIRSWR